MNFLELLDFTLLFKRDSGVLGARGVLGSPREVLGGHGES